MEKKNPLPKIKEYGFLKESTFRLDLSRRAYKIGFLYKPTSESIGIKFNIINFDYAGIASRFEKLKNNLITKMIYAIS